MSEETSRPDYEQVYRKLECENKELKMQVQELSCHIQYREKEIARKKIVSKTLFRIELSCCKSESIRGNSLASQMIPEVIRYSFSTHSSLVAL